MNYQEISARLNLYICDNLFFFHLQGHRKGIEARDKSKTSKKAREIFHE